MKSMLQEASSVIKAIEKAWADAGKPTEFTIKVLETGEKNFLGLSKRPSVVSITYEPKKQIGRPHDSGRTTEQKPPVASIKNVPAQKTLTKQSNIGNREQIRPLPKRDAIRPLPSAQVTQKVNQPDPVKVVDKEKNAEQLVWNDELVAFIAKDLKELLALWGIALPFSTKIDKKTLMVTLDGLLHEDQAEDRNVIMSFSYLLIQFLKRHYKKKFRGFQLIIITKKHTP